MMIQMLPNLPSVGSTRKNSKGQLSKSQLRLAVVPSMLVGTEVVLAVEWTVVG